MKNKAMTIDDYVWAHYAGIKARFARAINVTPQQIQAWIKMDCIVVDHTVYSPRRSLKDPANLSQFDIEELIKRDDTD